MHLRLHRSVTDTRRSRATRPKVSGRARSSPGNVARRRVGVGSAVTSLGYAGYRQTVFRVLLTPRWLLAVLLALVFAAVCVQLGRWQWGRYEDRSLRADAVTAHYSASPVPLGSVLGGARQPLTREQEWTRVTATGRYAVQRQLLVRNRVLGGNLGFEVLVPLDVGSGYLLVDRGWVPSGPTATSLPDVPSPPSGDVTVSGWLRAGEPDLGRDLPAGQLASITVRGAEEQLGAPAFDAYLVLETEQLPSGAVPARPAPLEPPGTDLGPHQAYAIQWWLTSVLGLLFLGHRIRTLVSGPGPGQPSPANPSAPLQEATAQRPRRTRIWDEEDY